MQEVILHCRPLLWMPKRSYWKHRTRCIQTLLIASSYAAEEKEALLTYKTAWKDYNTMLHQKAKLHWLKEGDENSKTFFNSIKARKSQNTINTVMREDGTWAKSPAEVSEAFITFYKGLLGSKVQGPRSSRKLWTLGRN